MDTIDKKIINMLQHNFPTVPNPFKYLGEVVGIDEQEVIERITALMDGGILRRIGGIFETNRLGFSSTLVAMHVPDGRIEKVAKIINSFDGVSHNYQRDGTFYNLWFTLAAKSEEDLNNIIEQIKKITGIEEILNLPAIEKLKMFVNFDV